MTKIYLIRHGVVENPSDILYGSLPGFHLSKKGIDQVQNLSRKLKVLNPDPCLIISSPLERAQETALIISRTFGGIQIRTDNRLGEWGMGKWVGKPLQDFYRNSGYYDPEMKMENLESLDQAADRAIAVIRELALECENKTSFIVSHRETMAAALIKLMQKNWPEIHTLNLPTASAWELIFDHDKFLSAEFKF